MDSRTKKRLLWAVLALAVILITTGVLLMVGLCAAIFGGLTITAACLLTASGLVMLFFSSLFLLESAKV